MLNHRDFVVVVFPTVTKPINWTVKISHYPGMQVTELQQDSILAGYSLLDSHGTKLSLAADLGKILGDGTQLVAVRTICF